MGGGLCSQGTDSSGELPRMVSCSLGTKDGLVHIAVTDGKDIVSSVNVFGGSRTDIRYSAAEAVIRDVITLLEGKK